MSENFILIDTQVIIAGATSTTASGSIPAVTEATATEIQSMRPEFNLSGFVKLKSPTFKDFVGQQNGYYIWTRGDKTLVLGTLKEVRKIPSDCSRRHFAIAYLNVLKQDNYIKICAPVLNAQADFSQVTALMIYDNVGHRGTGDKCLQSIIQCIESKKLT